MSAGTARRPTDRLTLAAIVDAAEALVATEGFEGLSMRKLAQACGVGAMTLYGYVPTKDELLGALAERLLSNLALPSPHEGDWAYRVAAVFHAVRRALLDHRDLLPVIAASRIDVLSSARGGEIVLGALGEAGLDDAQCVSALGVLTSFTVGACQREVGLGAPARGGHSALPGTAGPPGESFASVLRLAGRLATRDVDAEFSSGLDLLITGIRGWVEDT